MKGRNLELAVKRAAMAYRKEGRALLVQQHPRTATGPNGVLHYAGGAPADFLGAVGDAAAAVECKECEAKSFPIRNIDEDQRNALEAFAEYGFDVRLIIDMLAYEEVFIVPWFQVAAFLTTPWRRSLSIMWLRAFGQLVPENGEDGTRKVMFLDAAAHPESEQALLDVWDEREGKPIVSLDDEDEKPIEQKPSPYRGMTVEQVRARLNSVMQESLERLAKVKTRQWGKKRA